MGQQIHFLTLKPKYECSTDPNFVNPPPQECLPFKEGDIEGFCDNPALHSKVNYTDEESLDNWFQQYDLTCKSGAQVGLIGAMQSTGWLISALILPRVADLKGRKWVVFGALCLQLVCMAGTFFSTNLTTTSVIMFFMGLSGVGRMSLCILFLMELIPNNNKPFCGTTVVLNNAATYLYCAIYFWQISIEWKWLECFATGITLICAIGALFLPESPKFLITQKKYNEARKSLSYISKFNGVGNFTEKF